MNLLESKYVTQHSKHKSIRVHRAIVETTLSYCYAFVDKPLDMEVHKLLVNIEASPKLSNLECRRPAQMRIATGLAGIWSWLKLFINL